MAFGARTAQIGFVTAPLLQLRSVTKSFGAVRALKGVSFELRAGEVHALLGENGAGKSTLIKIITGAHQPDGGTLEIGGKQVSHLTPQAAHRLGIACIYQQPALFPDLTVAENLGLRLEPISALRRVDWAARRERAAQLLQRLGADISPDAEAGSLSMPEQQLVEIACALGAGARIVIMDEPTASLTQAEQHRLFAIVRDLRADGVGVIYISHRLDEIFALADRVTVLRDGESVGTRNLGAKPLDPGSVAIERAAAPHPRPVPLGEGESQPAVGQTERAIFADPLAAIPPLPAGEGRSEGARELEPTGIADSSPLTESELIRLMVGREVSSIYPAAEGEPGEVVLALRHLGCSAGGVRNITLEVRAGEIVGLAGLVGAGRTELARVLFGLTPADSGEIQLNGRSVSIRSPQQAVAHGIAYVPEDRRRHGVILEMPIAQNLTMAIHPRLFPGTWLRFGAERTHALEAMRDLAVKASGPDAPGGSLSGGNQQKVALARWLATKPRVLILDEPTQGVDVGSKSEIHKIIRRLAQEGLAVLLISSDLPEVLGMSDRIAVMRGGEIIAMLPRGSEAHAVMAAALGQAKGTP
jgi:ABC-type sugar transport system ATPase subunit